jgi:four helix bundle protein
MTLENRKYDLDERTFQFARNVGVFVRDLKRSLLVIEYGKQLIRSSASIGANFIEANDSLGKRDFIMRLRIARKEAKESIYWLSLMKETIEDIDNGKIKELTTEADEIKRIISAIIINSEKHST